MRLVHISDLHLGFRQYHRLTQSGINQREADVANAFRSAIDRIIALEPDVVVFAGDIFHTVRPMNPAIIHAFNQLARLTRAVPQAIVIMVAGNHDRPRATETGCILRLFTVLGVHVVDSEPRRLTFPERDLAILAVPDCLGDYPALLPEPGVRHNVLVLHGEVQGMLPVDAMRVDRAAMEIPLDAIGASRWSYVALGHYHVHREIAPNAFYSGSVDYTSTNPWGELIEERLAGLPGKGFIEFDLERRVHTFHPLEPPRRLVDLPAVPARGLTRYGHSRNRRLVHRWDRREDPPALRPRRPASCRARAGSEGVARVQAARAALSPRRPTPRDDAPRGERCAWSPSHAPRDRRVVHREAHTRAGRGS